MEVGRHDPGHHLCRKEGRRLRPRRLGAGELPARCSPAAPTSSAGTTMPRPSPRRRSAGIPTADLREVDWSRLSALVLAPGVPLTHPAPHWSVALARAAGVEVIGDIELFCRERRAHRAGRAVRRHHRHQRQIDHHRADRASPARRPATTPRWAAISAPRSCRSSRRTHGRVHVIEMLVLPDRSRAVARSVGRHPAQCQRGSSRPPRHAGSTTPP